MSTHRRTWMRTEERAADFFGARRRVLSGNANREDIDGDDSTHDELYIEAKLRDKHSVRTLFDSVKRRAEKAGKIPVLALFDKHKHGFMLCIHSEDFQYVIAQRIAALDADPEGRAELDFLVEQARTRRAPGWSRGDQ
jgi:hypothetical protein